MSQEEAARVLGWPKGTVSGRLARARDLLRARLARRGLAPSESALAALAGHAPEGMTALAERTMTAALEFAAGPPAALAEGVLRTMLLNRLTRVVAVLLVLGGAGAGLLRLLAELLGRDRLQLYLVRQAERQVVEYANAVLDRLSGGDLYLRLVGEANGEGSSAKALELEAYNRKTGEKPINVAFLSGSQKFRVAVSLAVGIGQYASRQHRPIESVIIDEGFGCLDSQGRQVMIQELQNLRSQMRCILLVSHQEEFAEAFSDGYLFRLENGATRVERFQK